MIHSEPSKVTQEVIQIQLDDFKGRTFVAFLDISGFKRMMKEETGGGEPGRALEALDIFYQCGYDLLQKDNVPVEGIFISDCGILFVRTGQDKKMCLESLLDVIRIINKRMLKDDFRLTTSIAYGYFKYEQRVEVKTIDKNLIYGSAYVDAFYDNEYGVPKIQPGQCRIVNLPPEIERTLEGNHSQDEILRLLKKKNGGDNNYYFYWMVETPSEIDYFEKKYTDAYNSRYDGMLKVLKMERCPICTGSDLSDDFNVIERHGTKVSIQGKIQAIVNADDPGYRCSPFSDYSTVSLSPSKGKMKYLKFRTRNELENWDFIEEERIRCEGCLHEVDGKKIVFGITNVEFL